MSKRTKQFNSERELIPHLKRLGFLERKGKGDHRIFYCPCGKHVFPVSDKSRDNRNGLINLLSRLKKCAGWRDI